jgi:catechol-2,3-dioxygenase
MVALASEPNLPGAAGGEQPELAAAFRAMLASWLTGLMTCTREGSVMPVVGLGHTGLWVQDLAKMRDFYERVIGLTVTDSDDEQGIVFFSSQPEVEHHEFVLQRGRTAPPGSMLTHQISWRVDSVETLQMYHHRFKAEGVPVQQEVTHGNAYGIYFFDPEGNRGEVYLRIPKDVRQPFRKSLNLEQSVEEVNAEAERLLAEDGPRYQPVTWTPIADDTAGDS